MRILYADTCYWIAMLDPRDQLRAHTQGMMKNIGSCRIITSEMVLVELLNALAKGGERMRELAVEAIKHLQENPNVEIVPQTSLQFQSAVQRYASRLDKGWSVTDCASFLIMEQKGVCDALTSDHHFAQASFNLLMK